MMKRTLSLAMIALLGACSSPVANPTFSLDATEAPGWQLLVADDVDVIVKFRSTPKALSRGQLKRELRLARARLMRMKGAEVGKFLEDARRNPAIEYAEVDAPAQIAWKPNDPHLASQWGLAKIEMEPAWDLARSSGGMLVAAIDTGVKADHPDLTGRVMAGYDFVNRDADPSDDNGHGTHVAGVIGASTNNAVGVAGVSPDARILPVKVLNASGIGSISAIAEGLDYAVARGARIVNMSLTTNIDSLTLRDSVNRALSAGVIVVAAAGNHGLTTPRYPAAYPGVISVTASQEDDTRPPYANHGPWVNIAAPGSSVLSTHTTGYYRLSGTSMAAPHVSGLVALMRARRSDWGSGAILQAMQAAGTSVTGYESPVKRINAWRAIQTTAPTPAPTTTPSGDTMRPTYYTLIATATSTEATISWKTNEPADGYADAGPTQTTMVQAAGHATFLTTHSLRVSGLSPKKVYYYRVRTKDPSGNLTTSSTLWFQTAP